MPAFRKPESRNAATTIAIMGGDPGGRILRSLIIFLGVLAGLLIIGFKGNISALIPLYAVGVFTGFTLSQSGMVVHHFREREPHWKPSSVINGVGALCTGIVAVVVVLSKFATGAWMHTILSPYRELTGPVLQYLDELDADTVDDVITVIIPEFVTEWKTQWLHNQSAFALKAPLLYRPNTVVVSVPVLVGGDHAE